LLRDGRDGACKEQQGEAAGARHGSDSIGWRREIPVRDGASGVIPTWGATAGPPLELPRPSTTIRHSFFDTAPGAVAMLVAIEYCVV
jgi:hypothetical protein